MKRMLLLLVIFTIAGCKSSTKNLRLRLANHKQWTVKPPNKYAAVALLHAYPRGFGNYENVSLYVCNDSTGRDSILLFDVDTSPDKFVFDKESENQGFLVIDTDIIHRKQKFVIVTVPVGFVPPTQIKYAFGKLSRALD